MSNSLREEWAEVCAERDKLREENARLRQAVESYAAGLVRDATERQPEISKMRRRGELADAAFHDGGCDAQRGIAAHLRGLLAASATPAIRQPAPDVRSAECCAPGTKAWAELSATITALVKALERARGYVLARSRVDEQDDNQEQARKNAAKAAAALAAIDAALLLVGRKP